MTQAYVSAMLARAKKPPKLNKLLIKTNSRHAKPRQTIVQQMAIANMWVALGYGRMVKPEN